MSTTLLATACGSGAGAELKRTSTETALRAQPVTAASVVLQDFRPSLSSTGTLVPKRSASLHALVEGRLDELSVDIGTRVRKGQRVFQVRTVDYALALQQAEAALARARVVRADRDREKARVEGLHREGSATEQAKDQAAVALEEAQAAVTEAEVRVALARQMLSDASVSAPYDGAITSRWKQKGEFVNKGDPVVEIMDLSTLEAEMEIPEPYAGRIETGTEVRVRLRDGRTGKTGRVVAVNPKVDLSTRTFRVKVEVDNGDGGLQAGLFCAGTFELPPRTGVAAVPVSSLQRDEGRSFVWVILGDKVTQRVVREAGTEGDWVYLDDGVSAGEQVVSQGAGGLYEGAAVSVGAPAPPAAS